MKRPLTARQAEILAEIERHIRQNRVAPTRAYLMSALGIRSPNGVNCHINALAKKGWIAIDPRASRGITVIGMARGDSADHLMSRVPSTAHLTDRQRQILEFIAESEAAGKVARLVDIAAALGMKTRSGAKVQVDKLERKGYLNIARGQSRGIRVATRSGGNKVQS